MVQPCIWFKEEPSQISMGQTSQSLTCSIMEKPRTGFDEFPRILLSCLRARNSQLHLIDSISSCLDFSAYVSSSSSLLQPLFHHHHGGGGRKRMRHFDGSEDFLYANKRPREEIQWHNTNFGDGFGEFLGYFLDPF